MKTELGCLNVLNKWCKFSGWILKNTALQRQAID